jgi:hypothetical protein
VLGLLADFSIRRLKIYIDGTSASGDYIDWGATAAAMYPTVAMGLSLPSTAGFTLRTTASEFTYAIPSGGVAWDS